MLKMPETEEEYEYSKPIENVEQQRDKFIWPSLRQTPTPRLVNSDDREMFEMLYESV